MIRHTEWISPFHIVVIHSIPLNYSNQIHLRKPFGQGTEGSFQPLKW